MFIVKNRRIFFALSGALVALSIGALAMYGLALGTDFTGGTLVEVRYEALQGERPAQDAIAEKLEDAGLHSISLRESGADGYTLRTAALSNEQRQNLPAYFSEGAAVARVTQLSEVGPTIGAELRNKAIIAMILVLFCILLFIAFAFRKVSKPISSWIYGLVAIVTLAFDVIIPTGFFAVLGHFMGAEVDTLFVTALLTILGFSVHDTIVVFDRTRENLRLNQEHNRHESFEHTAGKSLNQTIVRSINTSVTIAISLAALFLIGPESTKDFALTLLVGIIAGTFSSIALATPLLVEIEQRRSRGK